jgi:hypothetical protein
LLKQRKTTQRTWHDDERQRLKEVRTKHPDLPSDAFIESLVPQFPGRTSTGIRRMWGILIKEGAATDEQEEDADEEDETGTKAAETSPVILEAAPSSQSATKAAAPASSQPAPKPVAAPQPVAAPRPASSQPPAALSRNNSYSKGTGNGAGKKPSPYEVWTPAHIPTAIDYFDKSPIEWDQLNDVEAPKCFADFAKQHFPNYPLRRVWGMFCAKMKQHYPKGGAKVGDEQHSSQETSSDDKEESKGEGEEDSDEDEEQ